MLQASSSRSDKQQQEQTSLNLNEAFQPSPVHLFYRTPGRGGSLGTPNATLFTPRAAKTPKPTETVGHESDEEETTEAGGAGTALEYFSPMPSAHTTPAKVCKYHARFAQPFA